MTPSDRANARQRDASDPAVSAFVSASAGSGKTKLLTDRLLRLMLGGANPGRIQCLTFTKAAAAEMAVRLQSALGEWVTCDDAALGEALRALAIEPTDETRRRARALFAHVLDLPGGMRIGTIHAFCQSLLRRFPLEAQLSPHFRLVDDADAERAWNQSREDVLSDAAADVAQLALIAGLLSLTQFGRLVALLQTDRDRLERALALGPDGLTAAQRQALQAPADEATAIADGVAWHDAPIRAALTVTAALGSPSIAEKAAGLLDWLALSPDDRAENLEAWRSAFLTDGGPRGLGALVNKNLARDRPEVVEAVEAEQQRLVRLSDRLATIRVAGMSAALVQLAGPVVSAYARRKESGGNLDYGDLISRARRLMQTPGAAWVLFKLDGGLDHLLLDEVQDTAPPQWEIAGALTAEFFAGATANAARRTVFAVGDRKQSIFSFQGADPNGFDHWRDTLHQRVEAAGGVFRPVTLDVSFRSTEPVLALVDRVFANPEAADGVTRSQLTHVPHRAGQAGRVELWPLLPAADKPAPEPWAILAENQRERSAQQRLADTIAACLQARIGTARLPSRNRALRPGDVLILLRTRDTLAQALVRALKSHGVPVAGQDRMVLTEQPAVIDLLTLCDTLLLPQDDLSLACVLTSPLGGLDDDDLLALAPHRDGTLWTALTARAEERPGWAAAHRMIATLLSRVDYAPPYALLNEALGPLGGRARLFARLGAEAGEPVDELLTAALEFVATHPPSLQGFLHWVRQSNAEIQRRAEAAGDVVRIMTVHGAKGLQVPVVILPDTTSATKDNGPIVWATDPLTGTDVPLWDVNKDLTCQAVKDLREADKRLRRQEDNRLLYVAMTRAEDQLIVCGWSPKKLPDGNWHGLVGAGFDAVDASRAPFAEGPDPWPGDMRWIECAQRAPPDRRAPEGAAATPVVLPAWAGAAPEWRAGPLPPEPALPSPLAPSRPDGVELGQAPAADSPVAARATAGTRFGRGRLVHALLQHLPDLPPQGRAEAATRFLRRPGAGVPEAEVAALAAEILAVLDHPELAPLFGAEGRAEAPLTGVVNGVVIGGLVDRLAVLPHLVLIADYKTNRAPPADLARVPVMYLRQMAAYRALLAAVFPGRTVRCALVWTVGARVMTLPPALLDAHAPAPPA